MPSALSAQITGPKAVSFWKRMARATPGSSKHCDRLTTPMVPCVYALGTENPGGARVDLPLGPKWGKGPASGKNLCPDKPQQVETILRGFKGDQGPGHRGMNALRTRQVYINGQSQPSGREEEIGQRTAAKSKVKTQRTRGKSEEAPHLLAFHLGKRRQKLRAGRVLLEVTLFWGQCQGGNRGLPCPMQLSASRSKVEGRVKAKGEQPQLKTEPWPPENLGNGVLCRCCHSHQLGQWVPCMSLGHKDSRVGHPQHRSNSDICREQEAGGIM